MFDYLIVGAGLFGSVFAYEAGKAGKKCLVIDKRSHIGGNAYTQKRDDINIHLYGAHIFHTSSKATWDYINQFASFNNYVNSPVANYKGELYNLPFNMNTFSKMWGEKASSPEKALKMIESQKTSTSEPRNLEEQALNLVGRDIYEKLIKGYTEKQWGRDCRSLPPFIIKRLPVRFTFNNNYFNDRYQGIPEEGYTALIEKLLAGTQVRLGVDYLENRGQLDSLAEKVVYTGAVDAFYGYRFGPLAYRSLRFETERIETENYQGCAVVNYTEREIPYTRIIEHKHFVFGRQPHTIISREYPMEWKQGDEPYYPVNDEANSKLYQKYAQLVGKTKNVIFGGRLGSYKYYDMDKVISACFDVLEMELIRGNN